MKKNQIVFIIVFLSILFLPIITFNYRGTVSEKENRNLQSRPKNFKEANNYISDRFGFRNEFLKIYSYFPQEKINGNVIYGKQDWLFYTADGNLSDFLKTNISQERAKKFAENLKSMSDWCKENGIVFIAIVAPNKHSVYEEFYILNRPKGKTFMDYCAQETEKQNINFIWARDQIISSKKDFSFPLYYKTDTHWNSSGAKLYSEILNKIIENNFPQTTFPKIEYETQVQLNKNSTHDIVNMLTTHKKFSDYEVSIKPKDKNFSDYYEYIKNEGPNGVITKGKNEKLPRALIYRDSFFIALEPFTSSMFSEAEYKWERLTKDKKDYILKNKPDILIYESVERYAFSIADIEF